MQESTLRTLAKYATLLTLFVLMLGAYTRLTDAGLGCPDWPGCYGKLMLPTSDEGLNQAQSAYPDKPIETEKAWTEMVHRYVAGSLGVMILFMTVIAYRLKRQNPEFSEFGLSFFILALVIFQALLGMWTVTMLVNPTIVTLHLLGGMLIAGFLWLLYLRLKKVIRKKIFSKNNRLYRFALPAILLVSGQIVLGGWVSTNYAALACVEFPGCHTGEFWPEMNLSKAFVLNFSSDTNFKGGVLDSGSRASIHMLHRVGALLVLVYGLFLAIKAYRTHEHLLKVLGLILFMVLILQIVLGISNVILSLPLLFAVLHNGVAALLLLSVISIAYYAKAR